MTKQQALDKAIKLLSDMQKNDKKINNVLNSYQKNPKSVAFHEKQLKELENEDNRLYFEYYYFMKNLFGEMCQEEMLKFKDGFVDINFAKYMFKTYKPNLKKGENNGKKK